MVAADSSRPRIETLLVESMAVSQNQQSSWPASCTHFGMKDLKKHAFTEATPQSFFTILQFAACLLQMIRFFEITIPALEPEPK